MVIKAPAYLAWRTCFIALCALASSIHGYPANIFLAAEEGGGAHDIDYGSASFWERIVIITVLVLLGGVFAGMVRIVRNRIRQKVLTLQRAG